MKQSTSRVIAWVVLVLSLAFFSSTGALAQTNEPQVEQKGNVFIAKKSSRGSGACTKTNYLYEDSKGRVDTIYLSSTGKAFVWRVSKNGNTCIPRGLYLADSFVISTPVFSVPLTFSCNHLLAFSISLVSMIG